MGYVPVAIRNHWPPFTILNQEKFDQFYIYIYIDIDIDIYFYGMI